MMEKDNKSVTIEKINKVLWTIPVFPQNFIGIGQTQVLKMDPLETTKCLPIIKKPS